ncbi:MAG: PepSY-associated TM helix domain-containing protein [Breznakibacter sp.]
MRYLRSWHRDLGFLMVGACFVYAISGILLNHMGDKDPAFRTEEGEVQLVAGLDDDALAVHWNGKRELPSVKKIFKVDEEHSRLMLEGGVGVYNRRNGLVEYEKYSKREFVYWINRLHYSKVQGWNLMADFFAVSLIFFAISGLLMVKGKRGIAGRGKWFLAVGILIPVVYVLLA